MYKRFIFLLTIPFLVLSLCGFKTADCKETGHKWVEATCTEPKHCTKCDKVVGEELGHDVKDGKCMRCRRDLTTLESIQKICKLKATCQTDFAACCVYIDEDHNPYDVEYDYGKAYQDYVDMCDWSLVFDADYYIKTFPMLATLYHNDKDLLLEHFQTVGVHEGRQGCKDFNLTAYLYNCDNKVYKAFKQDYEGYYFYYMLHYGQEKNIDTINPPKGKTAKKQHIMVKTAVQAQELVMINKYRTDVDAQEVAIDSELSALANYRSYINSSENWDAHDWAIQKNSKLKELIHKVSRDDDYKYAENNVTSMVFRQRKKGQVNAEKYYKSPEHYEAMVKKAYNYCGVSNQYVGVNNQTNTFKKSCPNEGSQFDVYMKQVNTALNP